MIIEQKVANLTSFINTLISYQRKKIQHLPKLGYKNMEYIVSQDSNIYEYTNKFNEQLEQYINIKSDKKSKLAFLNKYYKELNKQYQEYIKIQKNQHDEYFRYPCKYKIHLIYNQIIELKLLYIKKHILETEHLDVNQINYDYNNFCQNYITEDDRIALYNLQLQAEKQREEYKTKIKNCIEIYNALNIPESVLISKYQQDIIDLDRDILYSKIYLNTLNIHNRILNLYID